MLPVACAVVHKNCCALVVLGGELAPCVSWVSVFLRALEKWEGKVLECFKSCRWPSLLGDSDLSWNIQGDVSGA